MLTKRRPVDFCRVSASLCRRGWFAHRVTASRRRGRQCPPRSVDLFSWSGPGFRHVRIDRHLSTSSAAPTPRHPCNHHLW